MAWYQVAYLVVTYVPLCAAGRLFIAHAASTRSRQVAGLKKPDRGSTRGERPGGGAQSTGAAWKRYRHGDTRPALGLLLQAHTAPPADARFILCLTARLPTRPPRASTHAAPRCCTPALDGLVLVGCPRFPFLSAHPPRRDKRREDGWVSRATRLATHPTHPPG